MFLGIWLSLFSAYSSRCVRLWGVKCGRAFGLIYIQRLITVLSSLSWFSWNSCHRCVEKNCWGSMSAFSLWLLPAYSLVEGSCLLPTEVVVCLLLYYFSPGSLGRSLALHLTEPHITVAATYDLCLFCVVTGSGFNSVHSTVATMARQLLSHHCGFIPSLKRDPVHSVISNSH